MSGWLWSCESSASVAPGMPSTQSRIGTTVSAAMRRPIVHREQIVRAVDAAHERALDRQQPVVDSPGFRSIHHVGEGAHRYWFCLRAPQLNDRLLAERTRLALEGYAQRGERRLEQRLELGVFCAARDHVELSVEQLARRREVVRIDR